MRVPTHRPSVDELYAAPELAVLAVLETTVDVALVALVAAHPDDFYDDDAPCPPERRAARSLVEAARNVASAVNRYRFALVCARYRERDELLPF